ncbi:MAG: helix-turn-helix transcriptional regulator, partial [Actinobacteria bacterium]|nr:helix-turn-helix transcriptional regulator [Actinomycetota bacterium]
IADLAAQGMSSRAIAEQLFLSTRTVENHLAQAFGKLGITSRDELDEALHTSS